MTPEQEHGITAEPVGQEESASSIRSDISGYAAELRKGLEQSAETFPDVVKGVASGMWGEYNIAPLEKSLNELEPAIEELREWGKEWRDKAIELQAELDAANQALEQE